MTCIAGLVTKDRIIMGCDSQVTAGWSQYTMKESKIVTRDLVGLRWLFGVAGSPSIINILRHRLPGILVDQAEQDQFDLHDFIYRGLYDELRTAIKEAGRMRIENAEESSPQSILVGVADTLYHIDSVFGITQIDEPYHAVGSGHEYAMGSLHATEKIVKDPRKRVRMAIEAACAFDLGSSGKIRVESIPRRPAPSYRRRAPRRLPKE